MFCIKINEKKIVLIILPSAISFVLKQKKQKFKSTNPFFTKATLTYAH